MDIIIVLIFGVLVGSFLNVCIYRIPLKQDIVYTPSHCMNCGNRIKWYDLVPILSWLYLKGKCRYCGTKLSKQYPMIELINGLAFVGIYLYKGLSYEMLMIAVIFSTLLVISMIDAKLKIIPNGLVIFLLVVGIIYLVFVTKDYTGSLIGFFAVSIPLLIINIITGGQMGMGDVKLMGACGLILGWKLILMALMLGSIIGSVIGLTLIALKITSRKQQIPFGPYLSIGIMLSLLFGDQILQWYLALLFI